MYKAVTCGVARLQSACWSQGDSHNFTGRETGI